MSSQFTKKYGPPIKLWRRDGFLVRLWDMQSPGLGGYYVAYEFYDNKQLIFSGEDYKPPYWAAIDSIGAVVSLLLWFILKPGDTDSEYFEQFTDEQMKWIESERRDKLEEITLQYREAEGRY